MLAEPDTKSEAGDDSAENDDEADEKQNADTEMETMSKSNPSPIQNVDHDRDTPITHLIASGDSSPALTAFQRDLLYAIAGKTDFDAQGKRGIPHGLALKKYLEKTYTNVVNHGRLYPNLDTLCHKGLVEKVEIDRRTNGYVLTDLGIEWMYEDIENRNEVAREVFDN